MEYCIVRKKIICLLFTNIYLDIRNPRWITDFFSLFPWKLFQYAENLSRQVTEAFGIQTQEVATLWRRPREIPCCLFFLLHSLQATPVFSVSAACNRQEKYTGLLSGTRRGPKWIKGKSESTGALWSKAQTLKPDCLISNTSFATCELQSGASHQHQLQQFIYLFFYNGE